MRNLILAVILLVAVQLASAQNVTVSLLAPLEPVAPGAGVSVTLMLLNTSDTAVRVDPPVTIAGRLLAGTQTWNVALRAGTTPAASTVTPGTFASRRYDFSLPTDAAGRAVLEIDEPGSARAVLIVSAPSAAVPPAPVALAAGSPPALAVAEGGAGGPWNVFAGHFSPHLPIYFLFGPDKPAAKFQFSFKYRILSSSAGAEESAEPPHGVYFGYTQRSLWDITAYSSPFYDTSYMPELLYQYRPASNPTPGWQWHGFQAAVQHESNGKTDPDSRSMNVIYVKPTLAYVTRGGWQFAFTPKVFTYIGGLSDNPDLTRYRGYGEYHLTVLKSGVALELTGRIGSHADKGSIQVDLTVPVQLQVGGFGTFLLVQYFDGYGESLLDYRTKSHTVRAGVSLVR